VHSILRDVATAKLASDPSSGSKRLEPVSSVSTSEIYSWASQLASETRKLDWVLYWYVWPDAVREVIHKLETMNGGGSSVSSAFKCAPRENQKLNFYESSPWIGRDSWIRCYEKKAGPLRCIRTTAEVRESSRPNTAYLSKIAMGDYTSSPE
jgi:hypothetical protein